MEYTLSFVHLVQSVVLDPSFAGAVPLTIFSFVNELMAVFPYAVLLAGQLFFLKGSLTIAMLAKLLVFVAVPVGVGGSLGVLPLYTLAYFGGKPAINKFKRYLRFSWDDVEKVNVYFQGRWTDEIIFFLLRTIPVFPSFPLSIAAGIFRMRFMPFFVLTTVAFIIRIMLTLLIVGVGVESLSQVFILIYNQS